jgi:uncharacterized RDD family membrane protein YckC
MEPESKKRPDEFALEYAGFWIRFGATIIDFIILLIILYTVSYTAFKPASGGIFEWSLLPIYSCIFWSLDIIYFVVFWTWRGQTPGKIVTGIKIIRTDSSPITWRYSLLRYLGCIVSTVILFIGFILIAFDSHKQGLHDKMADTYVVKLPVRQVEFSSEYLADGKIG